jgi:hypothetical protein
VIHVPISEADLLSRIDAHDPGWREEAAARVELCRQVGRFEATGAPLWSEIKRVYLGLQHNKCAYCERLLEGEPHGVIEHDVEHYRPKCAVKEWPNTHPFTTGGGFPRGYFQLAYSPFNYVTACKACNTSLKKDYFPIAGKRSRARSTDVRAYRGEEPLLVYPLGDIDERPETILTFNGITAIPVKKRGRLHRRAVVTIDFFQLNTREHLLLGRARQISHMFLVREAIRAGISDVSAGRVRAFLLSPRSEHTNCVRVFDALYTRDRGQAERFYAEILEYLGQMDP